MLRTLRADQLTQFPRLARSMFQDRAAQFSDRLKWEVPVGTDGFERDQYDALNPTYVIWENADGSHGGSMRFLPTMGRTMVDEHFSDLVAGCAVRRPDIWECTRFCLGGVSGNHVAPALMFGGLEFGLGMKLSHAVGVFDGRMKRVYARLGWSPKILGLSGTGRAQLCAGLWTFDESLRDALAARLGDGITAMAA